MDLAASPVEPVQFHYMSIAEPRGALHETFRDGWRPEQRELLAAMLVENRRWCRFHAEDMLRELKLDRIGGRLECSPELRETSGLSDAETLQAADKANNRHALWQMGEAIAGMLKSIVPRSESLAGLPSADSPDWNDLTRICRNRGPD